MLYHIVRSCLCRCLFQEIILESFYSQNPLCTDFYISSGFFQEDYFYSASFGVDYRGKSLALNPNRCNQSIILRGVYNNCWLHKYDDFYLNLISLGYRNVQQISSSRHHAKVFIACLNGMPVLEIIGSSNFTSTAYGINHPRGKFNVECDLVICNNSNLDSLIQRLIQDSHLNDYVIFLRYDEELNTRRNIQEEMHWIKENLFDSNPT